MFRVVPCSRLKLYTLFLLYTLRTTPRSTTSSCTSNYKMFALHNIMSDNRLPGLRQSLVTASVGTCWERAHNPITFSTRGRLRHGSDTRRRIPPHLTFERQLEATRMGVSVSHGLSLKDAS